ALVALVILALGILFFSINPLVKKGVESVGPKLTQVDVRLGAAQLSPLSGRGQLTKLFVGNPPGYKTPSAMNVADIKVGVAVSSVLSVTLVVDQVNIQALAITVDAHSQLK